MSKKILMGFSVLAMLAALPALAAEDAGVDASTEAKVEAKTDAAGDKIGKALDKAGTTIEEKTEQAGAAVKQKYSEVKGYFSDENDVKAMTSVNVQNKLTADKIIGAAVMGPKGEKIGKVEDILVSKDGDAERIVINDGGVLGLGGKMASFDYDIIEGMTPKDDMVVNLTDAAVKGATSFDEKAIPAELYSVKKITGSKVVNAEGKAVASVDTVAFDGDDAEYLIVTFNRILGMGGERAALDFEALDLANNSGKYTFKLNSQQTAQFENYKEVPKSN